MPDLATSQLTDLQTTANVLSLCMTSWRAFPGLEGRQHAAERSRRPARPGASAREPRGRCGHRRSLAGRLAPAHMKQVHNTGLPTWHRHTHFNLCVYICVHVYIKYMCVRVCLQGSLHLQIGAKAPTTPLPAAAGCERVLGS